MKRDGFGHPFFLETRLIASLQRKKTHVFYIRNLCIFAPLKNLQKKNGIDSIHGGKRREALQVQGADSRALLCAGVSIAMANTTFLLPL